MWKKAVAAMLLMAAAVLPLAGCGSEKNPAGGEGQTEESSENSGAEESVTVISGGAVESVVAVSAETGSLWLAAGGQLTGITDDGSGVENLTAGVSFVGGSERPNFEAILFLEPDLVLLNEDNAAHLSLKKQLEDVGTRCLAIDIDSFDDYDAVMRSLTLLTGRDDLYETHVTQVRKAVEDIASRAYEAGLDGSYLALPVAGEAPGALRNDHFLCAMLNELGLTNLAEQQRALVEDLTMEAVAGADPDYIFILHTAQTTADAEAVFQERLTGTPSWGRLRAVTEGHEFRLPEQQFLHAPNEKWAETSAYLAGLLGLQ